MVYIFEQDPFLFSNAANANMEINNINVICHYIQKFIDYTEHGNIFKYAYNYNCQRNVMRI